MNYPRVIFEDTPELRAQYLTYLAKQIACGWYQDRRFLILPRLVAREPRVIFFPDLNYPASLWKALSNYTSDDFDYFFPEPFVNISKELLKGETLPRQGLSLENSWRKTEKRFFGGVKELLPKFNLANINFIKVLPVEFGTVSSFYFEKKGQTYDFYHTIRTDFGPAQLAETILTQIMWTMQPIPKLTLWYQKEAIVDFLMIHSKLGQIFDYDYQPTVSDLPEISENLVAESEKYLAELGFPVGSVLSLCHSGLDPESIRMDSGSRAGMTPLINNRPVYNTFTATEKRVLVNLIANKNKVITYDQVGNLFWGDSEEALDKFNLASIAKIMEKIRKKIKDAGVYQELIFTVRGQGYILYD